MPLYQVQASLKGRSGLSTDVYTNNWHFEGPAENGNNLNQLAAAVWDFYNGVTGAGGRVLDHLSPTVRQNDHTVKVYKLDDPKPRVPIVTEELDFISAPAGTGLPSEVAITLSFRADVVSGVNMARRRGRCFIGPLDTGTLFADGNQNAQVPGVVINAILDGAQRMSAAADGIGFTWVVHSPTTGPLSRWPVTRAWVDFNFDTVRSRGRSESGRIERVIV